MTAAAHPWRLVAPWYRWGRYPALHPRDTPPVVQKYETTKLIELFRANPQHCLKFTVDDRVVDDATGLPIATGRRKLFLPAHKRFYLVVCELHCDRPGFPNANRADTCQAGFVVRRRRTVVPDADRESVQGALRRIAKRRGQVAMLERRLTPPPIAGAAPGTLGVIHHREVLDRQAKAVARLEDSRARLQEMLDLIGAREIVEGWLPSEVHGVGAWAEIDGVQPKSGVEDCAGLSPMILPPGTEHHAASGRAMWFAIVPTGSGDHLVDGTSRYDDASSYELRCFVRRHKPGCPRHPNHPPDCHGEVTWSAPSEPFRIASHFDLVGTANRPVTIQLPDIPSLLKQAVNLDYGQGAPVRMTGSSLKFDIDPDGKASGGSVVAGQICSFAIPLITIVATFVLRLFLPIVVLLFGLWALLRLKFCIPPSLSIDAGLDADVAAAGPSFDADVSVTARMRADLDAAIAGGASAMRNDHTNSEIAAFLDELQKGASPTAGVAAASGAPGAPGSTSSGPNTALAPLIWEDEVALP